jgi:heptosyltransferase-3
MKILVLQLARFGDIYQSWPALRALRRQYPAAHITFLVREKFKAAAVGLVEVDEVCTLDTARVLSPILFQANIEDSLSKIQDFISAFERGGYDRIVNLSFSPFSSYLTEFLAGPQTIVTGYSRTSDGFLAIPDAASAYFYAQSGIDRWSRVHVTDLFALIAGVELKDEDWRAPILPPMPVPTQQAYLAIQPSASQTEKTLTTSQWTNVVETLLHETDYDVVLLGAKEERTLFSWPNSSRIINLMGQTTLSESLVMIHKAQAFIGPDSVGLHMASLVATPTLNISVGPVRFWETGPRAPSSRVIRFEEVTQFSFSEFFREFTSFMSDGETTSAYQLRNNDGVVYSGPATDSHSEFQWRLTQALYMHSDYPVAEERVVLTAFSRIRELADLGIEQVEAMRAEKSRGVAGSILNEIDHLLEKVCELEPRVTPLANYFLTQKLRIGPGSFEYILDATRQCFSDLQTITQVYALPVDWDENLTRKDLTWKP